MTPPSPMEREALRALLDTHKPVQWSRGWECEGCPLVEGQLKNFDTWADWVKHHAALAETPSPVPEGPWRVVRMGDVRMGDVFVLSGPERHPYASLVHNVEIEALAVRDALNRMAQEETKQP